MSNPPLLSFAGRGDNVHIATLFPAREPVPISRIVPCGDRLFASVLGSDLDIVVPAFRWAIPVFRPKRQNKSLLAIAASLSVFNAVF